MGLDVGRKTYEAYGAEVRAAKTGFLTGWANYPADSKATATVFSLYAGQVLTQSWDPLNLYIDLTPESVIEGDVLGINNDPVNGWGRAHV